LSEASLASLFINCYSLQSYRFLTLKLEGRYSVLCLALTCRAFCDPALNVLHSHIGGIWPLIKFLPDQLDLSPRSSSVPTPKQFRPSVLRATCVQILFNHNFHRDDSAYALLLASAPKDAPLFPQLHSLGWFDSRVENIPVLNLLLPTVHILALDITHDKFRKAVFRNIRTTCLHLKALEFIGVVDKLATSELESLLFSYSEGLTELSIRFFRDNKCRYVRTRGSMRSGQYLWTMTSECWPLEGHPLHVWTVEPADCTRPDDVDPTVPAHDSTATCETRNILRVAFRVDISQLDQKGAAEWTLDKTGRQDVEIDPCGKISDAFVVQPRA
ncbi:hypothetical protein BDR06DRAFT_976671, partial [Suillus hirtellus]